MHKNCFTNKDFVRGSIPLVIITIISLLASVVPFVYDKLYYPSPDFIVIIYLMIFGIPLLIAYSLIPIIIPLICGGGIVNEACTTQLTFLMLLFFYGMYFYLFYYIFCGRRNG